MNKSIFKIISLAAISTSSILVAACSKAPMVKTNIKAKDRIIKIQDTQKTDKSSQVESDIPNHYKELSYPEFNYIAPYPLDYRKVLDSNTILYLYPSKQLPLVQIDFYFEEANASHQEKELAAWSTLGSMYIRGGSKQFSPEALEDTLEYQSIQMGIGLGERTSHFSLNVLKEHLPEALNILKEVALNPRFDKNRLELLKQQMIQSIEHKYDKPSSVSSDLYSQVMFGSHPSNWSLKVNEVKSLKVSDLEKLAKANFSSKKLYIGVAGDFDPKEMESQLQGFLKGWKERSLKPKYLETPQIRKEPGIHVFDFDATQTQIRIGQAFVQRPHPDYYAASLASYILGSGGFTSRLVATVRTEHGLAYSVGSFASSNYDRPSTSGVVLQTKVASTTQAIELVFQEIKKLTEEGPTDAEIQAAKDGLIEST